LTSKWHRNENNLIIFHEVDKKRYHYYTEKSFSLSSNLTFTAVGELQIFYLPMKSFDYHWGHGYNEAKLEQPFFYYGPIWTPQGIMFGFNDNSQWLRLFDYECLPSANSNIIT
jgi:hypothetical protein